MEKSRDMTVGVGTVAYMAPELMRAFSEHAAKIEADGTKCDMYSFAILALYVATGQTPYSGLSNENIFIKVGSQFNSIQFNSIQFNSIQFNSI